MIIFVFVGNFLGGTTEKEKETDKHHSNKAREREHGGMQEERSASQDTHDKEPKSRSLPLYYIFMIDDTVIWTD